MPKGTHRSCYGTPEQIAAQLDGRMPRRRPELVLPPALEEVVVGIDPGKEGGLAAVEGPGAARFVDWTAMPRRGDRPDGAAIERWLRTVRPARVVLENVHSFARDDHRSAFSFGGEKAIIEDAVARAGLPLHLVYAQTWQAIMLHGRLKDTKSAARELAQRLYPDARLVLPRCRVAHSGGADALCIATWGLCFVGGVRRA